MEDYNYEGTVSQENNERAYTEQPEHKFEEIPTRLPKNKDHLVAGIILTALFSVFGLPVLINACKARLRWRYKNYDLALASARKSGRWIAPSIILGVLVTTAIIAFYIWAIFEVQGGIDTYEPSNYNF